MRTMASIIGKPEDPGLEAARLAFSSEVGALEQRLAQREHLPLIDLRREEWEAAERIVRAYMTATANAAAAAVTINDSFAHFDRNGYPSEP